MPTRKLIEVALPLDDINIASAHEKEPFTRHHPRSLHIWWARRPFVACRAVLFASLIDDPDQEGVPAELLAEIDRLPPPELLDWQELPLAGQRRQRLFRFIKQLVQWENSNHERVLATAHRLIQASTGGNPPPVYDPFAGGGSIPLEAQRLGLKAYASDLNPVAVLINKALIQIPPKFANMPPVNPLDSGQIGAEWKGAAGLAADVRYYGKWMRDEAERRIGHLYPKVHLPKEHGGGKATVIAWIWARTVQCPNPACGAQMPLVRSFVLSTKKGKEAWIEPTIERGDGIPYVQFDVRNGSGKPSEGTVGRKGARCLCCGTAVSLEHVRSEGRAGRMNAQLMAIVAEGHRSRIYLPPSEEHEQIAVSAKPTWEPETDLPEQALGFRVQNYGLTRHCDLFTHRQLVALTTFCDLTGEVRILGTKGETKLSEHNSISYMEAIATGLALAVARWADLSNSLCSWNSINQNIRALFSRQAVPMAWDFVEVNPLASMASVEASIEAAANSIAAAPCQHSADVFQQDAQSIDMTPESMLVSTDPPYYDNVPYADLSDFFYVWLRAALKEVYPALFGTLLVPKAQELVAEPFRHGGREAAQRFFEEGLFKVFQRIRLIQSPDYPLTVYYAFKQAESDDEDEKISSSNSVSSSTGWETMLEGLVRSGFAINGTWPMRTEREARTRGIGSNALATSIVLVCRPRPDDARSTTRLEFVRALRRELPAALRALQSAYIAPVDLAQAAIGPGMAIYSRHKAVLEADGTPMRVRAALQLINQALDEVLAEQEGAYDADTRWAIAWFEQFAFDEGAYGIAETLSKAKNTSVQGMVDAGVALARAGKVRLVRRNELPVGWQPNADGRLTAWEMTQHLVWALDQGGEQAAAVLLQAAPSLGDAARDLAYRLYSTCERKKWAQEALAYNSLVIAWPEIARLAVERGADGGPVQGRMEL